MIKEYNIELDTKVILLNYKHIQDSNIKYSIKMYIILFYNRQVVLKFKIYVVIVMNLLQVNLNNIF